MPGLSEEEFINKYGFGVATMYTGQPPQLTTGYSPARVGLGERNVQIFKSLSPADQAAYNRALFGENVEATFAVALETENLSQTGGCTRKAIEQVFKPEQLKGQLLQSTECAYQQRSTHEGRAAQICRRDETERVSTITIPMTSSLTSGPACAALTSSRRCRRSEKMTPEQRLELKKLQDYERRVAAKTL